MKTIVTVLKVIWFIFCLSGNLYQIAEIASDFFSYQIVTTINVNFPETFLAPAMGVCLYEIQIADLDKLEAVRPTFKEDLNMSSWTNDQIHHKLKSVGVADKRKYQGIMFKGLDIKTRSQVVYKFHDLFSDCLLVKPDGGRQKSGKCSDLFQIVYYRFLLYVCYSFNFKSSNLSLEFLRSNRAETTSGFLYNFKFTQKAINITAESLLSYNMNHELDRMGYFRYLFLSELEHLISLTYSEYANSLLPRPYVTKCRRYSSFHQSDEDIIDRGSCYESCIKNKSVEMFGPEKILPGVFIFNETIEKHPEKRILDVYELYSNETKIDLKDNISSSCDKFCSASACEETFHVPILRSSIRYPFPVVITYVMQSPKIETICDPKLSLVVFLTNVLSTFGFWVGLSLYSVIEILINFLSKIFNRFIHDAVSKNLKNNGSEANKSEEKERKVRNEIEKYSHSMHTLCNKHRFPRREEKLLNPNFLLYKLLSSNSNKTVYPKLKPVENDIFDSYLVSRKSQERSFKLMENIKKIENSNRKFEKYPTERTNNMSKFKHSNQKRMKIYL